MSRLLIANFNNEAMMADRTAMTYELGCFSSIAAAKHMWFVEPGDIVVLPEPLSGPMAHYASKIKGFPVLDEATFISPKSASHEIGLIGFDNLHDPDFVEQLKSRMGNRHGWTLLPYYYDRSVAALARHLDIPMRPEIEALRLNGGHELLNDKKAFRGLAAGRGIPLAEGEACGSKTELLSALSRLLPHTGAVIVKQNRNACAIGNLILTKHDDTHCQGAAEVLNVGRLGSVERSAEVVWSRLASGAETYVIAEVYYSVQAICYAEFEITESERSPVFLNWGDQRMEPTFSGLEIPGAMPAFQTATFLAGAADLARMAKDIGFLGPLNIDGIVTKSGTVLFNEVNGRFGGSSHVHYLAELVAGPSYGDKVTVLTRNKVTAPHFEDVLGILDAQESAYSKSTGEGIVITGEDTERTGNLGIMTIGRTRARAEDLEEKFIASMAFASNSLPIAPQSLGLAETRH